MGGEAEQGGWGAWITGPEPRKALMYLFSTNFFINMVYSDPQWDVRTFTPDRDYQTAHAKMGPLLNAVDPDLRKFRGRGGKLILYHGWSDAAIPAPSTIDYYRSVQEKVGRKETEAFVRLYMIPGMQHCGGGPAPLPPNFAQIVEHWVEDGAAPGPVTATRNEPKRTRPLCPYPQVAHWNGSGSTDDAANFTCAAK
jgi:feruloyl esterase